MSATSGVRKKKKVERRKTKEARRKKKEERRKKKEERGKRKEERRKTKEEDESSEGGGQTLLLHIGFRITGKERRRFRLQSKGNPLANGKAAKFMLSWFQRDIQHAKANRK